MKRRRKDEGFALLLVFLLAACVAIMLYTEVPRVAFEAERQRELLLIDRGNQFKRAIQVFVTDRTNNPARRYPASVDELMNFNNHRYLRRRYKDPMTGKDEWRLVHINGGVLTDSVTTKAATTQGASTAPAVPAYMDTTTNYFDSGAANGGSRGGGAARAMPRRASDSQGSAPAGGPGGSSGPPTDSGAGMSPGGSPGMQGGTGGPVPGGQPIGGVPGLPGQPGATGSNGATGPSGGAQPQPCNVYIGSCPTTPAAPPAGQPGQVPPGGLAGAPMPGAIGSNIPGGTGGGAPGLDATGVSTPPGAAQMIQNLLTNPRPQGMPSNMPGATVGGGIAGVASKYEADGIMVINQRTAINEWEYIFDLNKYRPPVNPLSGGVGQTLAPMQGGSTGTPIGQQGGFGNMGPGTVNQGPGGTGK